MDRSGSPGQNPPGRRWYVEMVRPFFNVSLMVVVILGGAFRWLKHRIASPCKPKVPAVTSPRWRAGVRQAKLQGEGGRRNRCQRASACRYYTAPGLSVSEAKRSHEEVEFTSAKPASPPTPNNLSSRFHVPACCTRLPSTSNSSSRILDRTWNRRLLLCSSRRAGFRRAWSGRFRDRVR